jgi:ABC-type phosphate/phosphonate transport system ATPase subunit
MNTKTQIQIRVRNVQLENKSVLYGPNGAGKSLIIRSILSAWLKSNSTGRVGKHIQRSRMINERGDKYYDPDRGWVPLRTSPTAKRDSWRLKRPWLA